MKKVFDYELVYNYIYDLIKNELNEHDKIPSESKLCERFNLSRLTVRQGINKLKNEGYLYSHQGSGNFVSPKKIVYNISPNTTFTSEILKLDKTPSMKFLDMKIEKANELISEKLSIKELEKVLYIKNMRLVDDVPFLYAEYYFNLELLEGIEDLIKDVKSISELYINKYKLLPVRENSEIDITSINYSSKEIFNIQNDLPIIKISTKTTDKNSGKTIDYCHSYFRSDMAKIVVNY